MEERFKDKLKRLEDRAQQLYQENIKNKNILDFFVCHSGKMALHKYYKEYMGAVSKGENPIEYQAHPMDILRIYALVASQSNIPVLEFKEISDLGMSYN